MDDLQICLLQKHTGQWTYELWQAIEIGGRKYVGSNDFYYSSPDEAFSAAKSHALELGFKMLTK